MNIFRRTTPESLRAAQLEQARLELFRANTYVEEWVSNRDMLIRRIERLEAEKDAQS